jgi:AAA domain/Primase C terminal 2 (PriCT-2)
MADNSPPSLKPKTYNGNISTLPRALEYLREKPMWVCWSWVKDGERWTKQPRRIDNPDINASSSDPATWGAYKLAVKQVRAGKADGIGFALQGQNIGAFDLDHCRDPDTGQIEPWAQEYLDQFPDAYAEVTVPGTGLRILGASNKSISSRFTLPNQGNGAAVELFSNTNRYLTLSCNQHGMCFELPPIGNAMEAIAAKLSGSKQQHNGHAVGAELAGDQQPAGGERPWTFAEEARLRSALGAIPTDEKVLAERLGTSHDTWIKIGRAIERLGWGERGYAIWRDWSAQNAKEFNEKGLRAQWKSFERTRNTRANPVTAGTVYYIAKQFGWGEPQSAPPDNAPPHQLIYSSAEFVAGFTPPDYLVDGLLQRRFVYSLTGATGTGKTAIALLVTALIRLGQKLGIREVGQGRVLYFAGENPDDVRMRWVAMTQQFGFTPEDMDGVYFVPGVFKFSEIEQRIHNEMVARELSLVVIDTSAYFEGNDENDNVQAIQHAKRLRDLVKLPGGPTVLICCHPTKHATEDNLVPRGGGAFLAEVDGNLICRKDDSAVEMHWQGKFRGPDFAPMFFLLKTVTHERLKDTKGRLIPTVVAAALSEEGLRELSANSRNDEDRALMSIADNPRLTQRDRARELGWLMRNGEPYQMRVKRAERSLEKGKLIAKDRDGWELTDRGKKEIKRLKKEPIPATA